MSNDNTKRMEKLKEYVESAKTLKIRAGERKKYDRCHYV